MQKYLLIHQVIHWAGMVTGKYRARLPCWKHWQRPLFMLHNGTGRSPFVNPMCGSGTVAIEAAMIATNRRPGLFRTNYAFMHLQGYDETIYLQEDALLEKQIIDVPGLRIIATDYSARAIENAKKNAIAAGVANLIDFSVCDFADTEIPPDVPGIFYVNPEYGERLGDINRTGRNL